MTRRELLLHAARLGGLNFGYRLMESLEIMPKPERIDLDGLEAAGPARGKVLILGAGIAGMCAAYELEKLGYQCVLLEARKRSGGRCVSVRGGDVLEETGEYQKCEFQPGTFFNPGPTRVPYWHSTIDYCQKFGVRLDPWINMNDGAYIYQTKSKTFTGQRLRIRDVVADTEGRMAEVMAQSVREDKLNATLTPSDKQRILQYLSQYGDLDRDLKYTGKSKRGYRHFEGAGLVEPETEPPYDVKDLFTAGAGQYFRFIGAIDQQMTMLEIVGGVDQFARAFEERLHSPIRFGCEVTEIKTSATGATVAYHGADGHVRTETADFCVCTIPVPVLRAIPNNFDPAFGQTLKRIQYSAVSKVAMEFRRRFWEEDERIFGGITWTDMQISQILYPSHDFFSKTGVLVNYNFGFDALAFGNMGAKQRIQTALTQVEKIHPQAPTELRSAVTLAWQSVPYNRGAFVGWRETSDADAAYKALNHPQGRVFFAGEHVSHMEAWMAGAIESARYVVNEIHTGPSS